MSMKAFFLFIAASLLAFAIQDRGAERTTTLKESFGTPVVTTAL